MINNSVPMKPYIHKVRYYECDGMGVTHHSNYIRFMEEARLDMQDQLGYGYEKMEEEGVISPVVSVTCEYKRPTRFQDEIEIQVSLVEETPLRLGFAYDMRVGGKTVCKATSTHCFLERGRPVVFRERFPEFAKLLEQALKK